VGVLDQTSFPPPFMKSIEDIINREIEKLKQGFSIKLAERIRKLIIYNYHESDDFRRYYLKQIKAIQDYDLRKRGYYGGRI